MAIYIRATGNVSPQDTFGHPEFPAMPVWSETNRLRAIEPDYKNLIDVRLIRRMSRIIKMGVAAAIDCLSEAGLAMPDAVITGTAYGCLDDTGIFLSRMIEQNEEMLTPTAFIQSTHNTVGAQISLMLKCHNYNNTFVHGALSFESALVDAMMLLNENPEHKILVGGVDEITDASYAILSRFGCFRRQPVYTNNLFNSKTRGTVAGEGASFFVVASQPSNTDYATVDEVEHLHKPSGNHEIAGAIRNLISRVNLSVNDIDLVLTGRNGDAKNDNVYDEIQHDVFNDTLCAGYKHLCGEYPTSTSFALWLAANILRSGKVPDALFLSHTDNREIKQILIYNHSFNMQHSFLLLSKC